MYSGPLSGVTSALVIQLAGSIFILARPTGRYTYTSIGAYYFTIMLTATIHRSGHLMEGLFKSLIAQRRCLGPSTHQNPNSMKLVALARITVYVTLVGIPRFVSVQIKRVEFWC